MKRMIALLLGTCLTLSLLAGCEGRGNVSTRRDGTVNGTNSTLETTAPAETTRRAPAPTENRIPGTTAR